MRRVTIRTGRGRFVIQGGGLAVKRIAVTRRLLLMTTAAVIHHLQIEVAKAYRRRQMLDRGVTSNAGGSILISLAKSRAVAAYFIITDLV